MVRRSRRRPLSAEDRALWEAVARTVTPLGPSDRARAPQAPTRRDPDTPPAPVDPVRPGASAAPAPPAPARTTRPAPVPAKPAVTVSQAPDPAEPRAAPGMDRRRFERLRRGKLDPEARLDLHGMTAERAAGRLTAFIEEAHATGLRLVLVITGKGRARDRDAPFVSDRPGILRTELPHWLAAPRLRQKVLQVVPAHLRHGGTGAYYVYLRRARG